MAASVNEEVRDALIPHDLDNRRALASVEREIDLRLLRLERDLKALIVTVDPAGAQQRRSKKNRTRIINRRARELINTAYSEINAMSRESLRRLARTESRAVALTIAEQLT